jgi:hypothetical protein
MSTLESGEVKKEKVTMTHQKNRLNLEFQLSGEGVEITYLTNGQDGKPHFTYKDAEFDRSYIGDEIRIQQSDLGVLVTVTLRIVPDVGSDTVTLIVPRARVAELAEPVETLAIKCHNSMTMLPQLGAAQSYQAVCLKGSVQSTVLR